MKSNSGPARFLRLIVTIGILIYGVYYVRTHLDAFSVLLKVDWASIAMMLIFLLLTNFANAAENAILYQTLGAPVGDIESFLLTNVSGFFNLIMPQGGSLTKLIYLKQKHGVSYAKTSVSFLGLLVIYLLIGAFVILLTNLIILFLGGGVPWVLWVGALIAAASSLLFILDFPQVSLSRLGRIGALINSFSDGWKILRTSRSTLTKACVWQFISFVTSGLWLSTAFHGLGIAMSPLLAISLSVLISFTNILVLIPGNLGIQEAAYGYFTYLSGMTFAEGIVVSTLVRVVVLAMTLLLTPVSWYFLLYKQHINLSRKKLDSIR